jgi:ATP-binding cassette, subfamily C, bacterial CydC
MVRSAWKPQPSKARYLASKQERRARLGRAAAHGCPRAPVRRAPVLVWTNEPAAHLDPETARTVVAEAFDAAEDRSVLLITHHEEGLDLVDEIIPLGAT